tara:strand:+ start:959 stop:1306 length:348 start_codon:yes stop_codon:yes gene_type:complete
MNINEYIEKNCKLETENDGVVSITMCVPQLKYSTTIQDDSMETVHIKIRTSDMHAYLESKGYKNVVIEQTATIDNKHPKALTATWKFKTEVKKPKRKLQKSTTQKIKKEQTEKEK